MKTTINWLKEYCDFDLAPEDLAHRLAMAGCLVEEVTPVGDDVMLFADVTSNRPDHLGAIGIARDICALTGSALRLPPVTFETGGERVAEVASVEVEDPDLCPRYTARLIRGVTIGPSPAWLRKRLDAIGVRSINNVVDVTNYVLFECGQPMHAFDFAKLGGGRIVVRRARRGETLISIDETECRLTPEMLIIADAERPVAVAGIMGGLHTEIGAATTEVLLESAEFEKTCNRRTSRALQVASDSSYRFERGVDPVQVEWASRRGARLIQEVAGGVICAGVIDAQARPYTPQRVTLRVSRLHKVLGTDIAGDVAAGILERLGFEGVARSGDEISVSVPPFRANDVSREIDLIEEVIRIHGYEKIPERATITICASAVSKGERVEERAREALVGLGYHETMTNTFCTRATAEVVSPWTGGEAITVQNTVRREENRLRVSILPELLRVKSANVAHGVRRSPFFEISRVYLPRAERAGGEPTRDDALPVEKLVLAVLGEGDLPALKGGIEALLCRLGVAGGVRFEPAECGFFESGRVADILLGDRLLGIIGEVDRGIAERHDLSRAPCMAELDFDLLTEAADLEGQYARLPAYPAAVRDLAVVVAESVTWAQIEQAVRKSELPHLERIEFFDIFRGRQVPRGKKSIAFSLTFRAPDRTLLREEVEEARRRCIASLEALGGELRS